MEETREIEQNILKKYKKEIWDRMVGGIKDYQSISSNDRITVCISGGGDSMLLAKCLQMLQHRMEIPFELEFLSMDPGYSEYNRQLTAQNAGRLGIPLTVFSPRIFEIVNHPGGNPCYLCARMRHGHLYAKVKELGCNKIALAHHFDDVIETTTMGMLYDAEIHTMVPRSPSTNFPGMEVIRPLYPVCKRDMLTWKCHSSLELVRYRCPLSENAPVCTEKEDNGSRRTMVKELIARLREDNPQVDISISRSMYNVNLDTVLGYRQGGQIYSFLDHYGQPAGDILIDGDTAEEQRELLSI